MLGSHLLKHHGGRETRSGVMLVVSPGTRGCRKPVVGRLVEPAAASQPTIMRQRFNQINSFAPEFARWTRMGLGTW